MGKLGNLSRLGAAFTMLLAVAGCGGDGGGGGEGDPVPTDEAQATCSDFSAHATEWGWGGNINGADWNCGEAAIVWRGDVFLEVAACAIDLPCTGDGSACILLAYDATPLSIHTDYAARCEARKSECNLVGAGDASSLLLACSADALAPYSSTVIDSILACFDLACDGIVACLDDVL